MALHQLWASWPNHKLAQVILGPVGDTLRWTLSTVCGDRCGERSGNSDGVVKFKICGEMLCYSGTPNASRKGPFAGAIDPKRSPQHVLSRLADNAAHCGNATPVVDLIPVDSADPNMNNGSVRAHAR
jgi:hypothetical protein